VSQKTPDPRLVGRAEDNKNARFYRRMYFIRVFEQTVLSLFEEGLLNGTTHACIGQEADCVGVLESLEAGDHVFSNHRCHGHYLAKTGDAFGLLAEMMGRHEGACGGLGGSQHLCGPGFKSNGVLGGTFPAAAGIALAEKLKKSKNLSLAFLGDGSLGEGVVYETLNLASLWRLPLFIVLENNGWSQSTPIGLNMAGNLADRFKAFGLPVQEIETTDVLEIEKAARKASLAVRNEKSPQVLVIDTYRLCHHSKNDDARPAAEVEKHWKTEPLLIHGARLDAIERSLIETEVRQALDGIVALLRKQS